MVSAHAPPGNGPPQDNDAPTNKVIKILCYNGSTYKTFGENIILLLNRESKLSTSRSSLFEGGNG